MDTVAINHPERGLIIVGTDHIPADSLDPLGVVARFVFIRQELDARIRKGMFDPPTRYYG